MINNLFLLSRFRNLVERISKIIPLLDRWILFELLPPLFFSIAAFISGLLFFIAEDLITIEV